MKSCLVLVGGIIGCGKTAAINLFLENSNQYSLSYNNAYSCDAANQRETFFYSMIFDNICPIEDQKKMMKSMNGWKNFRSDLLLAAEYFINGDSPSEHQMHGPLTERSDALLGIIRNQNQPWNKTSDAVYLVEDNFYYRSMRHDWFQIARRANIGFCEVFLECPMQIALQRNSSRGYCIPEQKIKMMLSLMEFPDPSQFKWEKYSLCLDSSHDIDLSKIWDLVCEASKHPAEAIIMEEKIKAQNICLKNLIHQCDIILRKIVSKKISILKETSELKAVALHINENRSKVLQGIKSGTIVIPLDLVEKLNTFGIGSVQSELDEILYRLFDNV